MNLFVAKLNSGSTTEDLQKLFSHYGDVSSVRVIMDKETGNSKRYGFVEMPNDSQAKEALRELNETEFQQSVIVVKESQPRDAQPAFRGSSNSTQRRVSRPENNQGQNNFQRRNHTQRDFNRGNDSRGNFSQRSYDNRY